MQQLQGPVISGSVQACLFLIKTRLPAELRRMIWEKCLETLPLSNRGSYYELDTINGTTSRFEIQARVAPVHISGMNLIFANHARNDDFLFEELLCEAAYFHVIFVFESPVALQNFAGLLAQYKPVWRTSERAPIFRIGIKFFSTQADLDTVGLSSWSSLKYAHGYHGKVEEHIEQWAEVTQLLGEVLPANLVWMEITMLRPWRDYRSLRVLTAALRANAGEVMVRVSSTAWSAIPSRDFHISLTVACLKDTFFHTQLAITENEARELVRHGCRGFRVPRHTSGVLT